MPSGLGEVLVVDDDARLCTLIVESLKACHVDCTGVTRGQEAADLLDRGDFDVLLTDISMPHTSGMDLLDHALVHAPRCRVILMTGMRSARTLAQALQHGAYDYLQKPFEMEQLLLAVHGALRGGGSAGAALSMKAARALQCDQKRDQAGLETVRALVKAVEAKDPCTCRHSEHVAHYAIALWDHLAFDPGRRKSIRTASLLHDIGKIGIADRILTKPGRLTDTEFAHIRRHPAIGSEILENIVMFSAEARLIRHHHERWDGLGYPDGLRGEEIPLGARIIAIADALDAMLMRRSYKDPFTVARAIEELQAGAGAQFDPHLAEVAVLWVRANEPKMILHHAA